MFLEEAWVRDWPGIQPANPAFLGAYWPLSCLPGPLSLPLAVRDRALVIQPSVT